MVHQADGANKATLHLKATHQPQAIATEAAHTVVPNRLQSTKSSPWVAVQADVSTFSIERISRRCFYLIHVTYSKWIKIYNKTNFVLRIWMVKRFIWLKRLVKRFIRLKRLVKQRLVILVSSSTPKQHSSKDHLETRVVSIKNMFSIIFEE